MTDSLFQPTHGGGWRPSEAARVRPVDPGIHRADAPRAGTANAALLAYMEARPGVRVRAGVLMDLVGHRYAARVFDVNRWLGEHRAGCAIRSGRDAGGWWYCYEEAGR